MPKTNDIEMISVAALKTRGWSRTMVDNLLGEPDKLAKNPYSAKRAPARLYTLARVTEAEQLPGFKEAHIKAIKRSKLLQASAEKAVSTLRAQASSFVFDVTVLDTSVVLKQAIRSYNDHQSDAGFFENGLATESSDTLFLERITVNYIRHHLTEYDVKLYGMLENRLGWRVLPVLRERCFAAITAAYPHLTDACQRQVARKQQGDQQVLAHKDQNRYLSEIPQGD